MPISGVDSQGKNYAALAAAPIRGATQCRRRTYLTSSTSAPPNLDKPLLRARNVAEVHLRAVPAYATFRKSSLDHHLLLLTVLTAMRHDTRVLHVLAPMRSGGLERVVTMMSVGQMREGVHVAAVLMPSEAHDHPFVRDLQRLGVAVTAVPVGRRRYIQEYRLLRALIARIRPAVIHTHGYRADVIGGVVGRGQGIPVVSTVHGFTGGGIRNRFYERIQCLALRSAKAVMAVSTPLVDRLALGGIPRERIHCVRNGFAPASPALTRAAAREKLGIPAGALVAGWIGRLSPEKGPDVMLDALAASDASWHLCMVGEGPERDRLNQRAARLGIADRVFWAGAVPNAESIFSAFDAFVLSSRTEGTPITLLEAMHASVPIVATRVGGVPDVVTSAHALLVPPEKPRMIAHALAELSADRASGSMRSARARERVLQSFGVAGWLAAVDGVYRTACSPTASAHLEWSGVHSA